VRHTFAFAKIWGGMILSGPKLCLGSTNEARILPAFLHSPGHCERTDMALSNDYLLLIDEGNGLLMPKGILAVGSAVLHYAFALNSLIAFLAPIHYCPT